MVRDSLGQAASIDKDQGRRMLLRELREAIVDFAPHFVGCDRAKFARRHFDGEIHFTAVADLHDFRVASIRAWPGMCGPLDWVLCCGECRSRKARVCELDETLKGKSHLRAAPVV